MSITDIRVRKIAKQGRMKAIVSVVFDNAFVIHDIKIIQGDKGLFIAMPSRRTANGTFRDVAHPINSDCRIEMQKAIFEKYDIILDEDAAVTDE